MTDAGTIQNEAGNGVVFAGAFDDTLINSGSIIAANTHYAGVCSAPATISFVVGASAVLFSSVDGGAGSNTLELASAAGTGTLNGFATKYLNFETLTVDTGAHWALAGSNSIASGGSLALDGSLSLAGTLTDDGTLTNNGTLVRSGTSFVDPGTMVNNGSIGIAVTLRMPPAAISTTPAPARSRSPTAPPSMGPVGRSALAIPARSRLPRVRHFSGRGRQHVNVGIVPALVTVSLAAIIAAAKTINGNTTFTFPDHTAPTLIGVNHVDVGIFA